MNFFYLEMLANNKLLVPLAFILPVIYDGIFFNVKIKCQVYNFILEIEPDYISNEVFVKLIT